jgi:uncharacterized protein DUF6090
MINFFRKIRKKMADDNKPLKYIRYAIGEVVLVVIGILIALSINTWNEKRKERNKELIYLANINEDIKLNIASLEEFIEVRTETVAAVDSLLVYFNNPQLLNINTFNYYNLIILEWYPFIQHSNTYDELLNSGNLTMISNKEIKNELQNIQKKFESIAFIENEMQQDYERYLYQPYFTLVDLESCLKNHSDQLSHKDEKDIQIIDKNEIGKLLKIKLYKNGLVLASFNSNILVGNFTELIEISKSLIRVIETETDD